MVDGFILPTIKTMLDVGTSETGFDTPLISHINMAFMNLQQLGIGPTSTYQVTSATNKWSEFSTTVSDAVKTYIYLKTKLLFDPPTTSYLLAAIKEQITEIEWRLTNHQTFIEGGD